MRSVQHDRPTSKCVLISVFRTFAKENGWKVIPRHPLANEAIEPLEYDAGQDAIDWKLMDNRDYQNAGCMSVCMAECVSPCTVTPKTFSRIYVPHEEVRKLCEAKLRDACLAPHHCESRNVVIDELQQSKSRKGSDLADRPPR